MTIPYLREFLALPWMAQAVLLMGGGIIVAVVMGVGVEKWFLWRERRAWRRIRDRGRRCGDNLIFRL
jgi:hypothetical protein